MNCRLVEIEEGLYVNPHKVVAIKAVPSTEGAEEKCVVFMDSQSAASARFQVDRSAAEVCEEVDAALEDAD